MSVIQVGDLVRIRFIEASPILENTNNIYKVESIPNNQVMAHQFWEVSFAGDLFVIHSPVIMILEDGAP